MYENSKRQFGLAEKCRDYLPSENDPFWGRLQKHPFRINFYFWASLFENVGIIRLRRMIPLGRRLQKAFPNGNYFYFHPSHIGNFVSNRFS
jgi:hypothetical protein